MAIRQSVLAALGALALVAPSARGQTYTFTTLVADRFYNPTSLAVDAFGNVYTADDETHTIRKITPAAVVTTLAGRAGERGSADGPGGTARFQNPHGVAVDAIGNVYVTDSGNHTIRKITPEGIVTTLAGRPGDRSVVDGLGSDARFAWPKAIVSDAAGNLFIADDQTHQIRRVTASGVVSTLTAPPLRDASVDGPLSLAQFRRPVALALDAGGNLFVADFRSTVRKISVGGIVSTLAGTAEQTGTTDGLASAARFKDLRGIAVAADGTLFVADGGNATLRTISAQGVVTTIAGQVEQRDNIDGTGGNARFSYPNGIALDSAGNIFVADAAAGTLRKGTRSAALAPPIIHTLPATGDQLQRNVGVGTAISFTAGATGGAPLRFQWTRDGVAIPGATMGNFHIAFTSAGDEGAYVFTATNPAGSTNSAPISVRVYTPGLSKFASRRGVPGGSFLWGIASGGGQLVAVGTNGRILTSTDGRTWSPRDSGTTDWLVGVTYGLGKFVVVGDRGTILLSSDGSTWTRALSSGTTQRLNNVATNGSVFIAVGEAGTIVKSTDTQTWVARSSGVTTWLRGASYRPYVPPLPPPTLGPNQFYSNIGTSNNGSATFYVSGQNGVLLSSPNGDDWKVSASSTLFSLTPTGAARDIETLADGPIGIGQDGVIANHRIYQFRHATSPKAPYGAINVADFVMSSWEASHIGINARFRGLARGAGAIFATGENGVIAAAADFNGPWAVIPSGTTANLVGGVFHGNSLFIVGENETVLQSDPLYTSRLINISTRSKVGVGASTMVSGFVISGTTPKPVLIRAAGPALGTLGLSGTLAQPLLTLYDSTGRPIALSNSWSSMSNAAQIASTAASVGAFPFSANSRDAAIMMLLAPGNYTAEVSGNDNGTGLSLIEVYDAQDLASESNARAVNISTRGHVGAGADRLIAGFVINGAASRRVLIRAVGPTLGQFGIVGTIAEPQLQLYDSRGSLLQTVTTWSTPANADELRGAALLTGAFALEEGSKDAALVTTLLPGAYTVQVSGLNNTSGVALVEVYDLP